MDPLIIAFAAIAFGAITSTVVPYLIKVKEDDSFVFDASYLYAMVLSIVVASFAILPDEPVMAFKPLLSLFLAGVGLQAFANKGNAIRIHRKHMQ